MWLGFHSINLRFCGLFGVV